MGIGYQTVSIYLRNSYLTKICYVRCAKRAEPGTMA